jgi:GH35 family endo-1,4-beta-xylanase
MAGENDWRALRAKADVTVEKHRKGEARLRFVDDSGAVVRGLEVEVAQKAQDFLFGNLIFDLVWQDPPYRADLFKQRFLELFNFAIFPFYWPFYERVPGRTAWERMMPVLEWCRANGVTPKGHPLVWPYSAGVPEWLYDMPIGAPEGVVETLIKARVWNLVKGYAPFIQLWDVTNEAINHVSWDEATAPDFRSRYREVSLWRGIEVSGAFKREIPIAEAAGWVERAFRWAYAANPAATLIVNDYNQECDLNIRQRFFDLVRELQRRDVPVSGLGLQMHPVNHWLWPHEIRDTLEMYAELECPVHITELHQPAREEEIEGGYRAGTWTEAAQAEYLEQVYHLCFGHPSVVSINYWGLSDREIWIPGAGLTDAEYRPKPAFNALRKLIRGEWFTAPFTARTDQNGEIIFRGFFGLYTITERVPGRQHITHDAHLAADRANTWAFTAGGR